MISNNLEYAQIFQIQQDMPISKGSHLSIMEVNIKSSLQAVMSGCILIWLKKDL